MALLECHMLSGANLLDAARLLSSPASLKISNNRGRTPLMAAIGADCDLGQILEIVGAGSDWGAQDAKGMSAVALAMNKGGAGVARSIWLAHPDPARAARAVSDNGSTLAHIAAESNAADMLLAIAPHSDFSARDARGLTPLMSASSHSNGLACSAVALLAPWSDCLAVDPAGCDALMLAIENAWREDWAEFSLIISELAPRSDLFSHDILRLKWDMGA